MRSVILLITIFTLLQTSAVARQSGGDSHREYAVRMFLPASAIKKQYDALGITRDKAVIPHCHTNIRGSHTYFTLRLMGYDSVRAYEGSWSEYGNRDDEVIQKP